MKQGDEGNATIDSKVAQVTSQVDKYSTSTVEIVKELINIETLN